MLKRTISTNISNQGPEPTCFAHSVTRVILNAIRQTNPEKFYPSEENDKCDDYYDYANMSRVFVDETTCTENGFNNLIMYIYIYNLISQTIQQKSKHSYRNSYIHKHIITRDFN